VEVESLMRMVKQGPRLIGYKSALRVKLCDAGADTIGRYVRPRSVDGEAGASRRTLPVQHHATS